MTTTRTLIIAVLVFIAITAMVGYGVYARNSGVVAVQAARVIRQDLTQIVSANGEVKPQKYVNISSNTTGRIVRLSVKEGDHVNKGDLLIRMDSIQTDADVQSAAASLDAAQTELEGMAAQIRSSEAAVAASRADVTRSEVDLARARQNLDRAERMAKEGLISRERYDRIRPDHDVAAAQLNSVLARVAQSEAQTAQLVKQR